MAGTPLGLRGRGPALTHAGPDCNIERGLVQILHHNMEGRIAQLSGKLQNGRRVFVSRALVSKCYK